MKSEDLDYSIDVIQWCNENGITDRGRIKNLFSIIEKYILQRPPSSTFRGRAQATYPDYRALRKERPGLKMEEVAEAVGISKVQMHYIETRKTAFPNLNTLSKLNIYYDLIDTI